MMSLQQIVRPLGRIGIMKVTSLARKNYRTFFDLLTVKCSRYVNFNCPFLITKEES